MRAFFRSAGTAFRSFVNLVDVAAASLQNRILRAIVPQSFKNVYDPVEYGGHV
jgi:hypothetical protein